MRDYRNTTAYQLTRSLVAHVYSSTQSGAPRSGPTADLRRAAIAAAAHLADGGAQRSQSDYLRCLGAAREALAELPRHVNRCQLRGQLPPQAASALLVDQAEASAALRRLIAEAESVAS